MVNCLKSSNLDFLLSLYFQKHKFYIQKLSRKIKMKNREKLEKIFPKDLSSRQKQYEALRMLYYEKEKTYEEIANNFNFSEKYLRKIENLALTNKIDFFPEIKKGPKKLTTPKKIINKIIDLRKQNISIYDIKEKILEEECFKYYKIWNPYTGKILDKNDEFGPLCFNGYELSYPHSAPIVSTSSVGMLRPRLFDLTYPRITGFKK